MVRNALAQPLGDVDACRARRAGQQDGELLAPVPRADGLRAHAVGQHQFRQLLEDVVAGVVAVAVVERLEVVQVEHQQPQFAGTGRTVAHLKVQALVEAGLVVAAGEPIDPRAVVEPVVGEAFRVACRQVLEQDGTQANDIATRQQHRRHAPLLVDEAAIPGAAVMQEMVAFDRLQPQVAA